LNQISFVINTAVNELDHIKLLLESLKKNLDGPQHEILIFIDNDNQGTYKYLKSIKKDYYDLKIITHNLPPCIGYSRNNNLLVKLAKHNIVSYLQSDMVISPHYDTDILKEIEPNTILSATRVEPPLHGESPTTITKNFKTNPLEFNINEWNKFSLTVKENKTLNYFFAPFTFYKNTWLNLGGYDTLFRRSREDSDLVQRCLHNNIKLKQTFNAIVYHFTCTSSRGKDWFKKENSKAQERVILQQKADQIELKRFIRKWGGFNHGESKLEKYDVDLIIKNSKNLPLDFILSIEPLFSKVWVDDLNIKESLLQNTSDEHLLANNLLNFTEKQCWKV
jgi:GT2 family glycosyltransferase